MVLDQRVHADNPLRKIKERIDFSWVRQEVSACYGYKGNESVDPVIIVKLLFLLFYDNVKSERELMKIVAERLDYLWFLGYGLDDKIPDHSVLSKAHARLGTEVFEKFFVVTLKRCLEAGLVDASKDSVVKGPVELIGTLKKAYEVIEHKLDGNLSDPYYERKNKAMVSKTDPDAPLVRQSNSGSKSESRPRYKHHRVVEDQHGSDHGAGNNCWRRGRKYPVRGTD